MDAIVNAFRSFWESPWSLVGIVASLGLAVFISRDEQSSEPLAMTAPTQDVSGERSAFTSKPALAPRVTTPEAVDKEALVVRQLDRHVRMRAVGYYDSILGNPNLPEALKSRVRAEHDRLEALAMENRDIVSFIEVNAFPAPVDSQGNVTPELAVSLEVMRRTGALEGMQKTYITDLKRRAEDRDIPEQDRPTAAEVEAAWKAGIFPVAF